MSSFIEASPFVSSFCCISLATEKSFVKNTGDNIEFDVFWREIPNGFLNGYLRYHDVFLTQLFSVAKEMQQKDETKGEASIKLDI